MGQELEAGRVRRCCGPVPVQGRDGMRIRATGVCWRADCVAMGFAGADLRLGVVRAFGGGPDAAWAARLCAPVITLLVLLNDLF
jgi:hypothetical protein